MRKILLVMVALCVVPHYAGAYFFGDIETKFVSDTNVYNDNTGIADNGLVTRLQMNYLGNIRGHTYPRVYYSFWMIEYPDYDYENEQIHQFKGTLKQRLNAVFSVGVDGGWNVYEWPQAREYDSHLVYGTSFLLMYPSDFSEIEAGVTVKKRSYPDYDIDYQGAEYYVLGRVQTVTDAELNIYASFENKDYTDRYLYDESITAVPVATDTLRKDSERYISFWLKKYLGGSYRLKAGFAYSELDSNANEFWWGPFQSADDNTAGDEMVLDNYWDYLVNKGFVGLEMRSIKNVRFEVYGHVSRKVYEGWLARDKNDEIKSMRLYREDTQFECSLTAERELWKNLFLNGSYMHANNDSNDYPYDYISNEFYAGFRLLF